MMVEANEAMEVEEEETDLTNLIIIIENKREVTGKTKNQGLIKGIQIG